MVSARHLACLSLVSLTCWSVEAVPSSGKHTSFVKKLSQDHGARGLLDPLTASLRSIVGGILGSVASLVDESDRRPDAAHPYQAPGPTDQRGPCPALNTLANHGYISRSGIVSVGEVIQASGKGFNMGADVATILSTAALTTSGNIMTGVFSIGGEDDRTYSPSGLGSKAVGRQWGIDAHSRIETDASITRGDFFLNNGDNHSGIGSRFARFVRLAQAHGGQFSIEAANAMYGQNIRLSMARNTRLYQNGYAFVETLGEYSFVPGMFSNGTYGAGGVANYESISSLFGFQLDQSTGKFCYVPERFPDNWYRRATPYTMADVAINLGPTYLSGPLDSVNPFGALLTNPDQLPQLECAMYQGFISLLPAVSGQSAERLTAAVKYLQDTLLPIIPSALGCPINVTTSSGNVTLQTQDTLQETRPGGGQAYYVCSA